MGAFALVALLAGGPLGMCLALAYGVVAVMKVAKVDAEYARRGETPPGTRLIEKWLDGRRARGEVPADARPAKYGMWRYVWQRWQATWELAAQDHKTRHQALLKARADAAAAGRTMPKRPGLKAQAAAAWQWVTDTVISPVATKVDKDRLGAGTEPTAAVRSMSDPPDKTTPEGLNYACLECGQSLTLNRATGAWDHPSSAGCPAEQAHQSTYSETFYWNCPRCKAGEQDLATRETALTAAQHHMDTIHGGGGVNDNTAALLHDIPDWADENLTTQQNEGDGMSTIQDYATKTASRNNANGGSAMTQTATQQSGEVVGLTSAINYAAAVAAAHDAHSSGGGEQYMASLAQAEVGPETIQSGAAAQEASEIAAAAWHNHEAKLKEQLAAKEATTNETGKKDFLLAE